MIESLVTPGKIKSYMAGVNIYVTPGVSVLQTKKMLEAPISITCSFPYSPYNQII